MSERLDVLRKVLDAMGYAHEHGVIHRDLKPDNILVGRHGEVLIMDWGLARLIGAAEERAGSVVIATTREDSGQHVTLEGTLIGTPAYMSPEQARGEVESLSAASDIFSMGGLLYELLTHAPPYEGSTPLARAKLASEAKYEPVLHMARERLGRYSRRVPAGLAAIAEKAMQVKPERRYATAAAMRADLDAWSESRGITARRSGMAERVLKWAQRHPRVTIAAVLATVFSLVLVVVWMQVQALEQSAQLTRSRLEASERSRELDQEQRRTAEQAAELAQVESRIAEEAARLAREQLAWAMGHFMPADDPWFHEFRAAYESPYPKEENGYWDYVAMDDLDWPEEPMGWRASVWGALHDDDPAPSQEAIRVAQALLAECGEALALWDTAMSKPVSRGDVDFDVECFMSQELVIPTRLVDLAIFRLIATLEDDTTFCEAVEATAHAIITLMTCSHLIDAAIATVLCGILIECVDAHGMLRVEPWDKATLLRLDASLAAIEAAAPGMRESLLIDGLWGLWHAAQQQAAEVEAFIQREWDNRHESWRENVLGKTLIEVTQANAQSRSDYLDSRRNLDRENLDASESELDNRTWQFVMQLRQQLGSEIASFERYGGATFGGILHMDSIYHTLLWSMRSAETEVRMLRVALRLDALRGHTGELPATLDEYPARFAALWPDATAVSPTDDWSEGELLRYKILRDADGGLGFHLGSVGLWRANVEWEWPADSSLGIHDYTYSHDHEHRYRIILTFSPR